MTKRDCFQCGKKWDAEGHDGFECMKSLSASWEILDMALVELIDSRISVDQALKDWKIAIHDVKRDIRRAYQV